MLTLSLSLHGRIMGCMHHLTDIMKIFQRVQVYGADTKFKTKIHDLDLLHRSWVYVAELWVLHIVLLRGTFGGSLIKKNMFKTNQETWSWHEIEGQIPWRWSVTLALSLRTSVIGSANRLTEKNIWVKFNENRLKGSGDMAPTQNWRG